MSDSFFGFDASLPGEDDDGGGGRAGRNRGVLGGGAGSGGRGSDSEEEYDALNDETFGQAREDDWENLHEDLVRMDQREGGDGDSGADSDLDINFSSVGIDNFELDNDTEPEARLQLDPSVWTMPSKPETPRHTVPPVSVPLQSSSSVIGSSTPVPAASAAGDRFGGPLGRYPLPNPSQIRICSLEEIEQNMIKEQMRRGMTPLPRPPPGFAPPTSGQSQPMPPGPNPMLHRPVPVPLAFASPALLGGAGGVQSPLAFPPTNMPPPPPVGGQQQQQQQGGGPFPFPITFQPPPPNNSNNSTNNNNNNNNNNASFSQRLVEEIQQNHPMLPHYRQPPPTGGLGQPPLPLGVPPGAPGPGPVLPPMPPPHGNFKHHPFMTPPPPHHHPHPPFPAPNWNGPPHHHSNMAHHHHHGHHNHPGHHHFPQQQMQHHHPGGGHHPHHLQQQQHHQQQHHGNNMQQQQQQQQQGRGDRLQNGKLNRHFEYDEYANMMSERAKHWLLGIQLSQLNKETAYYNDYYFCVFRDRKERERGAERESKAHKDNTFYHPFSQQMLHRNGLIRERRNSDNSSSAKDNIKEIQPRRYKPVQFENSLGKLQCGSVIAPRKIIDQDVVVDRSVAEGGSAAASAGGSGTGSGTNSSSSDTAAHQRRSRQVLLHVENLYRLVLRLEDMSNPLAIEAKQQMKEKRAKERLLAQQENRATDEQNNVGGGPSKQQQQAASGNVSEVEQDTIENLLERILPGLNAEGVLRLLSVRKGKLLLKRIQKALSDHPARWTVWCTILATLVALPKRDREDAEDQLSPLFAQLELHVKYASAAELLPLFETLLNTDLLLGLVLKCKFLLLTVLTLIAQMEQLMTIGGLGGGGGGAESINGNGVEGNNNSDDRSRPQEVVLARWMTLLRELVRVLDTAAPAPGAKAQKVLLKLDSSCGIVKQLRAHLRRHQELDLERKLGALVAIIESSPAPSAKATPATELPESGGSK
ncbi:AGAP007440-PA-like protein [Anopheles sinensis]|uniref:AGAP007440-PA-like protein n=1 Tax=Anopheles sinensis TaxID=74873 RepID=A0A084WN79_ANOSI|nr:AGAP007440-PA-like protein [Anopheles sinensis]